MTAQTRFILDHQVVVRFCISGPCKSLDSLIRPFEIGDQRSLSAHPHLSIRCIDSHIPVKVDLELTWLHEPMLCLCATPSRMPGWPHWWHAYSIPAWDLPAVFVSCSEHDNSYLEERRKNVWVDYNGIRRKGLRLCIHEDEQFKGRSLLVRKLVCIKSYTEKSSAAA